MCTDSLLSCSVDAKNHWAQETFTYWGNPLVLSLFYDAICSSFHCEALLFFFESKMGWRMFLGWTPKLVGAPKLALHQEELFFC